METCLGPVVFIGVLDEIPSAYKDIEEVMANQADLVEPVFALKQILCVKG